MKLNPALVERTLTQFTAQPISEDHPAFAQLADTFGDHTFFVDGNGLNIVEPTEPTASGAPAGMVVNVATWSDANHTSLAPHDPEPTDVVVDLGGVSQKPVS